MGTGHDSVAPWSGPGRGAPSGGVTRRAARPATACVAGERFDAACVAGERFDAACVAGERFDAA
ncbi:hypothetical protein, partial [Ilumatobacter sp.]|uniref:hypothetical protein n=1 Tax=Ilumatobacter sp. TaxID=1967498 RepID=UPI003AF585ED